MLSHSESSGKPLPKSFVPLGQQDPKENPILVAKWEIIEHLNRLDWENQRKWQAYELTKFMTHDEDGERIQYSHVLIESLANRIKGHYIRQGKRPRIMWQSSPNHEGTVLYIKLNP